MQADLTSDMLTLYTLTGQALSLYIAGAELMMDDDELVSCRITLEVQPDIYTEWVDGAELFSLYEDVRQPQGFVFRDDNPYEVTIHIHQDYLSDLQLYLSQSRNIVQFFDHLAQTEPNSPLLKTQNWFAEKVMQQEDIPEHIAKGTVKSGYMTVWAGERAVGTWFVNAVQFLRQREWAFKRWDGSSYPSLIFKYSGGGLTWMW